jgi:hypothetical protein
VTVLGVEAGVDSAWAVAIAARDTESGAAVFIIIDLRIETEMGILELARGLVGRITRTYTTLPTSFR